MSAHRVAFPEAHDNWTGLGASAPGPLAVLLPGPPSPPALPSPRAAADRRAAPPRPDPAAGERLDGSHADGVVEDAVLAGLAHDLRTPLTTLRIMVDTLAGQSVAVSDEMQHLLLCMSRAVTWMDALIDNLATFSALRGGRLTLRAAASPVTSWIDTALAVAQPLLDRKGQTVRVVCPTPPPEVVADPVRLCQVVVNLLTNAARYGPARDVIGLRVDVRRDCVCVRVSDHGPGVPADEQQAIFGAHVRGRSARDGAVRGEGLGLYIVREIIGLHGGAVGVKSTPGRGASFWFTLPQTLPES